MSLSARISVAITAALTGAADLGTVAQALQNYGPSVNFADGSGAGQANKLFADTRTVNASSSEELDLAGVLTDAFGAAITFTKVKALLIRAAAGNANNVVIGGAAANAFAAMFGADTDTISIKPGGFLLLVAPDAAGYAVTAGTGDKLKIANSGAGTGVTYDVLVIGA